ncbi:MAG: carboxypeptidase-like regulatory domain-containing protein [Terracidiphilus sp.]|jgi:hypothetical protein
MREIVVQLGLVGTILFCAIPAQAIELIEFEHPFRAHHLAGVVVDSMGSPVAGVVIEDCVQTFRQIRVPGDAEPPVSEKSMILDCHFEPKHALASATTDANGLFVFPDTKMGTTHHLYVSAYGFDPEQITVKLRHFAKRNLLIRIKVAT